MKNKSLIVHISFFKIILGLSIKIILFKFKLYILPVISILGIFTEYIDFTIVFNKLAFLFFNFAPTASVKILLSKYICFKLITFKCIFLLYILYNIFFTPDKLLILYL